MSLMVSANGLGKKYRLGSFVTNVLRERIAYMIRRGLGRTKEEPGQEFWALRDVSFEIEQADVVGLIGRNGAGKSTLLKILSSITEPTEGEAHLYGRVASLLEVGIGFHPELSGRENIFLNGAILGMKRTEIRRKFDEIVQFAEVEKFLDTPVKRYSSGMYVRLAFAVAAHLDPDILIVDEVLAVGDSAFQQKCLGKMRSIHQQGKTVILVSHNMSTVGSLCHKVIWLSEGHVREVGPTRAVIGKYLSEGLQNDLVWTPRHPKLSALEIHSIGVLRGDTSAAVEAIPASAPIDVVFDIEIHERFAPGHFEVRLMNDHGETILTSSSADGKGNAAEHDWPLGRQQWRCRIPGNLIVPGRYFLTITEPYGTYDIVREGVIAFSVSEEDSRLAPGERHGKIAPLLEWSVVGSR
jgi:lipopolysaccharide transport system ATP-binding protein